MKTKIDFSTEKTSSGLLKMAIPLLIAMILNMAYNIVDSLWIGNMLGKEAMAALTSATPIILIMCSVGMGATNGLTILLSRAIGSKDNNRLRKILSTSCLSSAAFCIIVTLLCEIFIDGILKFLKTPDVIFSMAKGYLGIYFLGFIAVYFYLYFTAVLRSYGNSIFQVAGILFCTILNLFLDPLFIKLMGIKGAAVATVLSQSIAVILMIIYVIKKKLIYFKINDYSAEVLKDILNKAVPSVVQQTIPALSTTVLTAIISTFGVNVIASYGVIGKLETILLYPAMVINMSLTTIVGQCLGAKKFCKIKEYLDLSIIGGSILLIILSIAVISSSYNLSGLFLRSSEVALVVKQYFLIVSVGYILNTVTNCYLGALNGYGKPMMGMSIMIFYYIIVRMPLSYILSKTYLSVNGVWIAVLVSHIVAAISSVIIFLIVVKGVKKRKIETIA